MTYNVVVALVMSVVSTVLTKKAVLKMKTQLGLSSTLLAALGTGKRE
jgi:hypothetical protein